MVRMSDRWTLYGAGEVIHRTGITYRQLDHWVRIGLVEPSIRAQGPGHVHRFDNDDIDWIACVADLVHLGVQPLQLRDAVRKDRSGYVTEVQAALARLSKVVPLTA
jgi:DNA-binding transcriptional MerR regulator